MLITNQPEQDLGELKFGIAHNFKYVIQNIDGYSVDVTGISLGCTSCTTASVSKNIISPGEKADVNVVFTPGSTGINIKTLTIKYNINGSSENLPLKFKAKVSV